MPHMDEGQLQAWLDGRRSNLSDPERAEIAVHLAHCPSCAARVEELRATDAASRALLGAMGADDAGIPAFSEIVARAGEDQPVAPTHTRPAPRGLPLQWAASIVLAVGVGWMANEVARSEPGVISPIERSTPATTPTVGAPDQADAAEAQLDQTPPDPTASSAAAELGSAPPESQTSAARLAAETEDQERARQAATPPAEPRAEQLSRELRADSIATAIRLGPETTWVSGRITDPTGRPLQDVVVTIPGTNSSALSRVDGRFRVGVATDSLGPDAELHATMIGYAMATRDIPVGSGDVSIDDVRLEQSAVQLEGVVVTGTAISSERRATQTVGRVSLDGTETWQRVGAAAAEAALGDRPMRLPGLEWTEVGTLSVAGTAVVRVTHETAAGETVALYQSRAELEFQVSPEHVSAVRVTDTGVHLLVVGPRDRDDLADLLRRAVGIASPT